MIIIITRAQTSLATDCSRLYQEIKSQHSYLSLQSPLTAPVKLSFSDFFSSFTHFYPIWTSWTDDSLFFNKRINRINWKLIRFTSLVLLKYNSLIFPRDHNLRCIDNTNFGHSSCCLIMFFFVRYFCKYYSWLIIFDRRGMLGRGVDNNMLTFFVFSEKF